MHIIEYIPTYEYFSQFDDMSGKVLDMGCNAGNLIASSDGRIQQSDYTGIDVDAEAVIEGDRRYPQALWIGYTRWHPVYAPDGVKGELPPFCSADKAYSYSLFSHLWLEEFLLMASQLALMSTTAFVTYCNIDRRECVEWFRSRREDCEAVPHDKDYVYLVDNQTSTAVPDTASHFVSFYRADFIVEQLKQRGLLAVSMPPPQGWYQDCLKIQAQT